MVSIKRSLNKHLLYNLETVTWIIGRMRVMWIFLIPFAWAEKVKACFIVNVHFLYRIFCAGRSQSFSETLFPSEPITLSAFLHPNIFCLCHIGLHFTQYWLLPALGYVCLCRFFSPLVLLPRHVCFPFAMGKKTEATVTTLACSADFEKEAATSYISF